MERNIKKTGGFTIVEIMVSMMLVSIALVAVVAVFPRMTSHRKSISEMDQARIIAMEALEVLQVHWTSDRDTIIDPGPPPDTTIILPFQILPEEFRSGGRFYRGRNIQPAGSTVSYKVDYDPSTPVINAAAGFYPITVIVEWPKKGGGKTNHKVEVAGALR